MKFIKRKAALLLTTAVALVGLFWIAAFTADDVTQGGPSVALNIPATTAAPNSNTQTSTARSKGPDSIESI